MGRGKCSFHSEEGQSLAMSVVAVMGVLLFSMFAIDFGISAFELTRQSDTLQRAEAACMEPYTMVRVKNADDPGRVMCNALVDELRREGFNGQIEAYYYEPAVGGSASSDELRTFVFGATVSAQTPTVFASMVGVQLPVMRTRAWVHAQAYASAKVWRPSVSSNGRLMVDVGVGSAGGSWTSVSAPQESILPGVSEALRNAGV